MTDSKIDADGRYIFRKGLIGSRRVTLANIYAPNANHCPFFSEVCDHLTLFREGMTIIGGDFNVPLNPLKDTSRGLTSIPYRALKKLKDLALMAVHDAWRLLNPTVKDFTFYSPPLDKYSRIDYYSFLRGTCPCSTLRPLNQWWSLITTPSQLPFNCLRQKRTKIWRYHRSLLSDPLVQEEVQSCLTLYFKENATPGGITCLNMGSSQVCAEGQIDGHYGICQKAEAKDY